jgi:hypothetical protein
LVSKKIHSEEDSSILNIPDNDPDCFYQREAKDAYYIHGRNGPRSGGWLHKTAGGSGKVEGYQFQVIFLDVGGGGGDLSCYYVPNLPL